MESINTKAIHRFSSNYQTHEFNYLNMRTTTLFLTLAYAASMVMAAPVSQYSSTSEATETTTTSGAKATESVSSAASHTVTTYSHCNRPGVFALTFDDGPSQYSWGLAKSLKDQGIKATFFINGNNAV